MRPGLVGEVDVEPEGFRDLIVIHTERRADIHQQPVNIGAVQPGIFECILERIDERHERTHRSGMSFVTAVANAYDGGLIT